MKMSHFAQLLFKQIKPIEWILVCAIFILLTLLWAIPVRPIGIMGNFFSGIIVGWIIGRVSYRRFARRYFGNSTDN